MMDKNIVILEGVIGDDFKYGKTQEGKEYATFSLCVNAFLKEISDTTEGTHSQTYVRIFVYDKRLVDYLKRVNAKRGQRASVFGRLSSFKNEYKGISFMTNNIVCRDVTIIKTRNVSEE
jgi:single-stranded DNA-binding protein